jgi:DNA mismatch repair protein MSH6
MACLVEPEGDEQKVTFLYRLAEGPSPKSYGINVARLAHLPREVIQMAKEQSEKFESFMVGAGEGAGATSGEGPPTDPLVILAAELLALVESTSSSDTLGAVRRLWSAWTS